MKRWADLGVGKGYHGFIFPACLYFIFVWWPCEIPFTLRWSCNRQ